MFNEIYADNQKKIALQAEQIDSLKMRMAMATELERLAHQLAPEIKVLFPHVDDIALSRNVFCSINSNKVDTVNLAIVKLNGFMTPQDTHKLEEYLEVRSGVKPIKIVRSEELGMRYR